MRIKSIAITNLRCFASGDPIQLAPLTVLIGRNNAGKSTLLRAVGALQAGSELSGSDVRLGSSEAQLTYEVQAIHLPSAHPTAELEGQDVTIQLTLQSSGAILASVRPLSTNHLHPASAPTSFTLYQPVAPDHLVVPWFPSTRSYSSEEQINTQSATAIRADLNNLGARLLKVLVSNTEAYQSYARLCTKLFQAVPVPLPSQNGIRVGIQLSDDAEIGLQSMGDGVRSTVGMAIAAAGSVEKILLVEEPENSLHPDSLKALLEFLAERSCENQVIIATHSPLVVNYLAARNDALVYFVGQLDDIHAQQSMANLPRSFVRPIVNSDDRRERLAELGVDLPDMGLHSGWIVFEEASAEYIVKSFLIPWFVPELSTFGTVSATGVANVPNRLAGVTNLILAAHLEGAYQGRVWAIVDGGAQGRAVLEKLQRAFSTWGQKHFLHWNVDDFERYYPARFTEQVAAALSSVGSDRGRAKHDLLLAVMTWCGEYPDEAKTALETSAAAAIQTLKQIAVATKPIVPPR